MIATGNDEAVLPPELLVRGDIPVLAPTGRGDMLPSAVIEIGWDRLPALNSSGIIPLTVVAGIYNHTPW